MVEASIDAIERTWVPASKTATATSLAKTGLIDRASCDNAAKQTYGVLDVGCATGHTMLALLKRRFAHVFGVDSSSHMLEACSRNLQSAGYTKEAHDQLRLDATFPQDRFFASKDLGAVIANWTLHFITNRAARAEYLRAIHEALVPGGCLVLTEKTSQDAVTRSMYHAWKQEPPRNVSGPEIAAKAHSLRGVLKPLPVAW